MSESPIGKPKIYLAVILPILGGGATGVFVLLMNTFARLRGMSIRNIPDLNGFLILMPALFLWIPIALLLSNCILYVTPPLHRIANEYATRAGRPGFWKSQKKLFTLWMWTAIICIPLIALGFWL